MLLCRVYERTLFKFLPVPGKVNQAAGEKWEIQKSKKITG
jgi:hypothetical protein